MIMKYQAMIWEGMANKQKVFTPWISIAISNLECKYHYALIYMTWQGSGEKWWWFCCPIHCCFFFFLESIHTTHVCPKCSKNIAWPVESFRVKQTGTERAYLTSILIFMPAHSIKGRISSPVYFSLFWAARQILVPAFQCIPFSHVYIVQLICEFLGFVSANYSNLK